MPRRRANEPGTSRRRRTRSGCQRCRARKIKCDEGKPECGQCRAKGFQCPTTAPLKWEHDYRSRGLAFGRTGIWSKDTARPKNDGITNSALAPRPHWCRFPRVWPYSFVNATVAQGLTTAPYNNDDNRPLAPVVLNWSSAISPNPPTTHPLASTLLSYYLQRLCPLTVSSPSSTSPFATLVFPYSLSSSSPAVLESVLALSACHRAKQDVSFKDPALRLAGSVLRRLRHRLKTEDATHVARDSDTLVIMVMLCLFEIVNECDERWVVHLRGARDLIRLRNQVVPPGNHSPSAADHDQLAVFAQTFFAYQDVLGRTACGEEPIFGDDFWVSSRGTSSDIADPWLGCSPELVSILCGITALSRRRAEDAAVVQTTDFHMATASLDARLARLRQHVATPPDDDILQTSAELKRLAAAFYLDCALRSAHPFLPQSRLAISRVLRLVALLLGRHVTAGLAWPIFVAAVELDPLEDTVLWADDSTLQHPAPVPCHGRPFVLYALDRMAGSSLSNVSQTRTVIERVWQSRDLEALQDGSSAKCPTPGQNDWERHVAPFCHGLSLG